ncbi:MAG: right-handed parallel beta-helix repeat-containing protein [Planctomycetes bacterium]|nr:right-handed parallel beta-helix repeat-containing protein [Planctomycetota bacterium]
MALAVLGGARGVAAQLQVPGNYPTIQAAIAAANPGDTVVVAPGTYAETLDFLGKDLTVRSSGGPLVTTIRNPSTGFVAGVTFHGGETPAARLEGFTLRDFRPAVEALGSAPTIRGNRFVDNWFWDVYVQGASAAAVIGNAFLQGRGDTLAVEFADSDGVIALNGVRDHARGGVLLLGDSQVDVHHNVIKDSGGWNFYAPAIFLDTAAAVTPLVAANVLLRNGVSAITASSGSPVVNATIRDNRFLANVGPNWSVLAASTNLGTLVFEHNLCLGPPPPVAQVGEFVRCDAGTLVLRNNVFARNVDTNAALWTLAIEAPYGPLTFENNLLHGVEQGVFHGSTALATVALASICWDITYPWNTLVGGGIAPAWCDIGPQPQGGPTNISLDPRFVDPADGDYHLLAGSPCIDAPSVGTTVTRDLDGRPRDATPDLGPYEYVGRAHWFRGAAEGGTVAKIVAQGQPGEAVFLGFATALLPAPVATPLGNLHLAAPAVLFLGSIGANGILVYPLAIPASETPVRFRTQAVVGATLTTPVDWLVGG